jgi:hypothetical protein
MRYSKSDVENKQLANMITAFCYINEGLISFPKCAQHVGLACKLAL